MHQKNFCLNSQENEYQIFLKPLKTLIETIEWETGKYGGKVIKLNGNKKRLPHRVLRIHKLISNAEQTNDCDWEKIFNQVVFSANYATVNEITFFGLKNRDQRTQNFYDHLIACSQAIKSQIST